MRKVPLLATTATTLVVLVFGAYRCSSNNKPKDGETKNSLMKPDSKLAFKNHRDSVPSKEQYNGPLFVLSHNYPATVTPVVNAPWQKAISGGLISKTNAASYMDALKNYVAPNIIPFFKHNKEWTSAKYGWFNEPWLGSEREAILGTYQGNGNPANMFKTLKTNEAGYVLVLYDSTAAYTVGQIWNKDGDLNKLEKNTGQFAEGSVIVKLAFSNVNAPEWPVMEGAQTYSIYDTLGTGQTPTDSGYKVRTVSFFQMDVIVKDSKAAPQTGWVYSTFVYDKDIKGDFWQQMVPLGAMWGNDPDVVSGMERVYMQNPKLNETWINDAAPYYGRETLGWGGRLSGPNDGAVAQQAYDINTNKVYNNLPVSSCMSCHSPAQYHFESFLLPGKPSDTALFVYTPGSTEWRRWFRSDYGNVPFDKGQIALDYDMVMAFKSIKNYLRASKSSNKTAQHQPLLEKLEMVEKFRRGNTSSRFWH